MRFVAGSRGAVILVGPLLLALASERLREDHVPYWRSSMQDTSYAYAFNALDVAELKRPAKVDHPGTTLEMLGAGVLRLRHLAVGSRAISTDFLSDPERYCRDIHRGLVLTYVLGLLVSGFTAMSAAGDLGLALALQLTPLLAGLGIFLFNAGVAPEPLLLTLAALLASAVFWSIFRQSDRPRLAIMMGIVCGIGLATKWTFLPLCLLPLLLNGERRSRIAYVTSAVLTFALAMVPAWPNLGTSFGFATSVAINENLYRSATRGLPTLAQYLNSLRQLLGGRYDGLFPLLLALGAAVSIASSAAARRHGDAAAQARRARLALAATTAVCVLQVVLAAKDPMAAKRYLVPAAGLTGLSAALLLVLLRQRLGTRVANRAISALLVVGGAVGLAGMASRAELRKQQRVAALSIPAFLSREGNACRTIRYAGSSSVEWALYHGDHSASGRFGLALKRLYPDVWFYDGARQGLFDFEQRVPLAQRQRSGCVLLWGLRVPTNDDPRRPESWAGRPLPPSLRLQLVYDAGAEAVYRLGSM